MYSVIVTYRNECSHIYAADLDGVLDLAFVLNDAEHVKDFMVYNGETPCEEKNFGWIKMEKWIAPYKTVRISK